MHDIPARVQSLVDRLAITARIEVSVLAAAVVLMTYLGPFGTDALGPGARILYWSGTMIAGSLGARAYNRYLRPFVLRHQRPHLAKAIEPLFIALAVGTSLLVLEPLFRAPIPLPVLLQVSGGILLISIAVWAVIALGVAPHQSEAEERSTAYTRFEAEWPPNLRGAKLKALAAEDHYIRVFTDLGEALVSGQFKAACDAVSCQRGSQVHRSWWVTDNAVTGLKRTGGKWTLLLTGDLEVPVSRRYRPEVRAMGWDQR